MYELPFAAGLQLIDADLASKGIDRIYIRGRSNHAALDRINQAIESAKK